MEATSTRDTVVALHLEGLTYGQIRYATGLSRGTIGGHLARWRAASGDEDARVNGRVWTEGEDDDLRRMFAAGALIASIADALGRTPRAIHNRLSILRTGDALSPRKPVDDWQADKSYARQMREADARFLKALALAFQRGDHLREMARAA